MSIITIAMPMVSLFLLIFVGLFLAKKDMIDPHTEKKISALIVNVFNPFMLIVSSLGTKGVTHESLLVILGIAIIVFTAFVAVSGLTARFFDKSKEQQVIYRLMFTFGNVGFIGIPVVSAMIGPEYLVYVAEFNLVYCLYFYTWGIYLMEGRFDKESLKKMINMGTICALLSFVIVWFGISLPDVLLNTFTYLGNCSTPLALILVGVSLSKVNIVEIFRDKTLYVFSFVKLIVIPVAGYVLLHLFGMEANMAAVCVLMIGMPVGNLPLMLGTEKGLNCEKCAASIIMTTLFSLLSIPVLVTMIVG